MLMPAVIVRYMAIFGIGVTLFAIWLGASLPGTSVVLGERNGRVIAVDQGQAGPVALLAGGRAILVLPMDLVSDSDIFDVPADLRRFHRRQTMLSAMMRSPGAVLVADRAQYPIQRHRSISGIPPNFWIILLPGLLAVAISSIVLAANPGDTANRLVAVSGVLFSLLTASIAIVATRDIAIDGAMYRAASIINEVCSVCFAVVMVILFCIYPRRIVPDGWLWPAAILALTLMLMISVGRALEWTHPPGRDLIGRLVLLRVMTGGAQMSVVLVFLALCGALAMQFRVTRQDPLARAALIWFGLSVAIGAGGFISLLTLPNLLGVPSPVDVSIGFLLLLLIYVGLAFGLMRYRLFAAKAWSLRVLLAALGTVALLLTDAALIYGLGLHQGPALGVSLILIGLIYQPARAWLNTMLSGTSQFRDQAALTTAIDVAFASENTRGRRWRALLQRLFDPLEITSSNDAPSPMSRLVDNGVAMLVPDATSTRMVRLAYAGAGTRLFSPTDVDLADELTGLCRRVADALRSYDRGAADERQRMAQDLHDDVGARLLSGIHIARGPVRVLLQDALRDIRTLVTGLIGESASLSRVIADIRHETASRLEAAGIELDWPLMIGSTDVSMSYRHSKAITSALREAVSNTIRHAGASRMSVRINVDNAIAQIDIVDDGCGIALGEPRGNGLSGITRRMAEIGGEAQFCQITPGTRITLIWPLDAVGPLSSSNENVHAR